MFDCAEVCPKAQRLWTMLLSLIGQLVLLCVMLLIPLITTNALPGWNRVGVLHAPAPQTNRVSASAAARTARTPAEVRPARLLAPVAIPDRIAVITETLAGVPAPAIAEDGVVSSNGILNLAGAGAGGAMILDLLRTPPAPPPLSVEIAANKTSSKPVVQRLKVSGVVRLEATISRKGTIENLRVLTGHPLLIAAAVTADRQWRSQPTSLNREP